MIDVAVIGAGPVGSAAALLLSQTGRKVALFDPRFARDEIKDQACGEGIMPAGVEILDSMGVLGRVKEKYPIASITYISPNGRRVTGNLKTRAVGIQRTHLMAAFDECLSQSSVDRFGVRVQKENLISEGDGIVVEQGPGVRLKAKYAVWSTGIETLHAPQPGQRWGMRQHFKLEPNVAQKDTVEVFWKDAFEGYVTPVSATVSGVAFLCRRPIEKFEQLLSQLPELQSRLDYPLDKVRAKGPFPFVSDRPKQNNVIAIGDAAGYDDPITGDGITLGLLEARLLSSSLNPARLSHFYCGARQIRQHHAHWVRRAKLFSAHPKRCDWAVWGLSKMPGVFRRILVQADMGSQFDKKVAL